MCDKVTDLLESLICRVNAVTAYHRHGQAIPAGKLDDLANKQIEIEEALASRQAEEATKALPDLDKGRTVCRIAAYVAIDNAAHDTRKTSTLEEVNKRRGHA